MDSYEGEKYYCTSTTLKETLAKFGVAIIPRVLDDVECKKMEEGMWEMLRTLTADFKPNPITKDDVESWRRFFDLYPLHSMLLQHWKIGHAQYIWDLRQNAKILAIWKELWGTDDLLVSFDGASYHFPPEKTRRGWVGKEEKGWLHTDQSYTRNDFECIQSWVTALDVNDGDATLAFLEGSNRYHGDFAKEFKKLDKADWTKLESTEEYKYYTEGNKERPACPKKLIRCPKGSLVFWDSRTIHCGQEPMKVRKEANFRSIVYLCYTPRSYSTPVARKKKVKYLEEQRMTTHWPHKIKVFAKAPRTYGKPLPELKSLPAPILTPEGRRLAGYD